jgi:hypothetical protein
MKVVMQVVCAWCGCHIKDKEADVTPGTLLISHSICETCKEKVCARDLPPLPAASPYPA